MELKALRIGVLMGGRSAEREVSLRSGQAVLGALRALGYEVAVAVDAGPDLPVRLRQEGIQVAFLVLHGGWGEDGSVQGLLEVMGIPYTGSGVLASALAMDKVASRVMFAHAGLKVPRYEVLTAEAQSPTLPPPWVVKPAKEGSSIGVSMVEEPGALREALREALRFGPRVLLEERLRGREVHVGILKDRVLGSVEVRPRVEFYSYEAKYRGGLTEYILPPELSPSVLERTEEAALRAHLALGCRGATRVDLIVSTQGQPYVLEVNTIPGMTETSLLPKIAQRAGLSFPSLVEAILKEALSHGP